MLLLFDTRTPCSTHTHTHTNNSFYSHFWLFSSPSFFSLDGWDSVVSVIFFLHFTMFTAVFVCLLFYELNIVRRHTNGKVLRYVRSLWLSLCCRLLFGARHLCSNKHRLGCSWYSLSDASSKQMRARVTQYTRTCTPLTDQD